LESHTLLPYAKLEVTEPATGPRVPFTHLVDELISCFPNLQTNPCSPLARKESSSAAPGTEHSRKGERKQKKPAITAFKNPGKPSSSLLQ